MTSMLADAQFVDIYNLGSDITAYRFQKDGQDLVVAWMNSGSKTVTASFDGELVITDLYGNATTHTGTAQLNLSSNPIYIEFTPGAITSIG